MNLSLKTLTITLAASAAIAFGQDAPQDNPNNPAAAVEKAKEVVAAVQEVNAAGAAAEKAEGVEVAADAAVEKVEEAKDAAVEKVEGAADLAAEPVEEAKDVQDVHDAPATGDDELEGVTVTSGDDPDKITVSLDAVELEDVVRLFTRLSGANIICNTTNLHGTVTANLADIGWKPAFKAILRQQGLALLEDPLNPDVYEIGVPPPAGKEPFVSKTFKLNYLKASEAATVLRNFLGLDATANNKTTGVKKAVQKDKDGNVIEEVEAIANEQKGYVVAHPAANTVIVSCRGEDKMREVEKVIADLDVVRQQVYIEAKIVQVSGSAAKRIGVDWSMLDGYTISAGSLRRSYTKTQTRTVETKANGAADINWSGTDNRNNKLGPVSLDGDSRYGDIWDGFYRTTADIQKTPVEGNWAKKSDKSRSHGSEISDIRTAIFDAGTMQVALSALETSDDVAQISNPQLIVANEERAVIDMTTKEPYVKVEHTKDSDNNDETWSIEMDSIPVPPDRQVPYIEGAFFSYGISVDVTPRINNASNITVVIQPTLSDLAYSRTDDYTGYYRPGDGYTRFPIIDTKSVRTVFSLGNGQTAVIGGLTTSKDKEVVKKVPLLGSIPILKYLFSHTEKVKEQYETIIFVTVGIVSPENKDFKDDMMSYPDGARLIQKRIDANGKIIDKRFKDLETKEQAREADLREAEAKGLVVPEVVEE